MFQSTPGIAAGRIRALGDWALAHACFNPRPALLPGESFVDPPEHRGDNVSIHARHCCRANQKCYAGLDLAQKFQSTPGIAAGRILLI